MLTQIGYVKPYQQMTPDSCGAAVLKAVLQHWDDEVDERDLIREVGVTPEIGSTFYQVANAAHKRGYWAQTYQFRSIDELAMHTYRDVPVILGLKSFTRAGRSHFVVVTAIESDRVQIMDPNVRGNRRTLSRKELDERWQVCGRLGLVVMPRAKPPQFGEARTLVDVLRYLNAKNGDFAPLLSANPVVQSIASAVAGIFATMRSGTRFLEQGAPGMVATLQGWSSGLVEPSDIQHPGHIAAILLWADTWKNGPLTGAV